MNRRSLTLSRNQHPAVAFFTSRRFSSLVSLVDLPPQRPPTLPPTVYQDLEEASQQQPAAPTEKVTKKVANKQDVIFRENRDGRSVIIYGTVSALTKALADENAPGNLI
jgi:hypothetical protein